MIRIVKNRILDACLKFILLSALVHTSLLVIYSLAFWDFGVFNYFDILDIGLFIPGVGIGTVSLVMSGAIMATLFLAIFLFYTKSDKKRAKAKRAVIAVKAKNIADSAVKKPELD
jgi:hypothetical protein